jgi:hypothetical protein
MTVPPPITATVRHWAPVLMRHRTGLVERIALDPMDTAVSIRGVDPAAPVPLSIPVGHYRNLPERFLDVLLMEGRIWTRIRPDLTDDEEENGIDDEPTLANGLAALSGERGMLSSPFRPRIPEGHGLRAHEGGSAIPPRALSRASEGFHEASVRRVRDGALRDLAHDGVSILVARDHPVIRMDAARRAETNWRAQGPTWLPVFRRDRMDEALAHLAFSGSSATAVEQGRSAKESFAPAMAHAMRDVELRDDDLRQFVNRVPFVLAECLAGMADRVPAPDGLDREIARLCALAAIDAVGDDLAPAVELITRASAFAVENGRTYPLACARLQIRALAVHRYATEVAAPRLAGGPVPDDDAASLGSLAP